MSATKSKEQKSEDFLLKIRKRVSKGISADKENRDRSIESKKFIDNQMWSDADKELRKGRPCLTVNRINPAIDQAIGDQRQNLPGLKVRPVSSDATVEWAQIKEGKIRHITAQLKARQAINKASANQMQGGMGHIRVITEFASDKTWNQKISIVPLKNELSVVFDPAAEEWDRNDGQWLFIYKRIGKDSYKEKWDGEPQDIEMDDKIFEWRTEETVVVGEYYYKEWETKTLYLLEDGTTTEIGDVPEDQVHPETGQVLHYYKRDAKGDKIKREVKSFKIYCVVVDGAKVLEEKKLWPSKSWPVVPVWGKAITIQGKDKLRGIPWDAMDPSRMYNYYASASAESYGLAPKAKTFATPQMVVGHEDQWNNMNNANYPYILVNPIDEQNPASVQWPFQIAPPQASTAIVSGLQQAAEDIRTTTGRHLPSLGAPSNVTSGVAIVKEQHEGDVGDYEYTDNANMAFAKVGEIVLELMPTTYDTTRNIRTLGEDGVTTKDVKINEPMSELEAKTQGVQISSRGMANDMTEGDYEVVVDVGPSFSTQRQEAAATYTQMIQTAPQMATVLGDIMMRNQDIPESQTVADRLRIEMILAGKKFFKPEEIQELIKKYPMLAMPQQPNPLLMATVKEKQAKALKAFMDAMKIGKETEQLDDSHLMAIASKMNEIYQQVMQQQAQQAQPGQMPGQPGLPGIPGQQPGVPPQMPGGVR